MEKIELTTVILDGTQLNVACEVTSFVNHRKVAFIDPKVFARNVKELADKCKASGVKLSRKRVAALLKESEAYLAAHDRYVASYWHLQSLMEKIVEAGLYPPLVDHAALNEAYKVRNEMEAMFWRSQILSRFSDAFNQVNEYLGKDLTRYEKIWI